MKLISLQSFGDRTIRVVSRSGKDGDAEVIRKTMLHTEYHGLRIHEESVWCGNIEMALKYAGEWVRGQRQ